MLLVNELNCKINVCEIHFFVACENKYPQKLMLLTYIGEVLTRRVSALLDDPSLFASRIVILRDVSPPFSGKNIEGSHRRKKKEKMVWSVFKYISC